LIVSQKGQTNPPEICLIGQPDTFLWASGYAQAASLTPFCIDYYFTLGFAHFFCSTLDASKTARRPILMAFSCLPFSGWKMSEGESGV
jgi:hypothetical protein